MIQNLWWAAGYNIVAIPLAAGILAPWGILLQPALGAVLMSLSTVVVAINAQLLRRAVRHGAGRSEEHTSELQSRGHLVCRLLLEKKKKDKEEESTMTNVVKRVD